MQLNVVYLTDIALDGHGGRNYATREVFESLMRIFHGSVYLICPRLGDEMVERLGVSRERCGWLSYAGSRSVVRDIVIIMQMVWNFWKIARRTSDVLIVTRFTSLSIGALLLSRLFRVPMILLVRGYVPKDRVGSNLRKWYLNSLARACVNRSCGVFVAYEEIREWLVGIGAAREKIRLFYNCADPKKFRAIDRAEARRLIADRVGYFGEEFVVGFVGTLKEYHAVDVLLEAIRLLRWMNLRVHCLIVGDGPCREELVRLARDLGIGSYVRFAGSVEHDRVNEFICACDLMYGYIRKDYGSPIKCYEYLSCGRLVLARNTEELRFVKDLGVGYLFDNPGPDEIAEKIAGFMNLGADEIKLRSVLGREFVVKERSWDLLAREIREMVREVGGV